MNDNSRIKKKNRLSFFRFFSLIFLTGSIYGTNSFMIRASDKSIMAEMMNRRLRDLNKRPAIMLPEATQILVTR